MTALLCQAFGLSRFLPICLLSLAGLTFAAPARAQTAASQEGLQEVIVTAQHKSEKLDTVPISVSAFSGADLQKYGVKNTTDLQFTTPGLVFPVDNDVTTPYVRGVGTGFSGTGLEGSVAQYIDDVYYENQQGGIQKLLDIDQIQVLKGPQGTLYGRNATGGALLITTHDPTPEFGGNVSVGAGNLGEAYVQSVLNVPLAPTLFLRLAGSWENQDGYVHNTAFGGDIGGFVDYRFRGKLLWKPTDDLDILASLTYNNNRQDSLIRVLKSPSPVCVTCYLFGYSPAAGFYDTIQTKNPTNQGPGNQEVVASLKATYRIGDAWTLSSITGYHRMLSPTIFADQDDTPPDFLNFIVAGRRTDRTFTQEFRVASSLSAPLNYAAGVFIEKDQGFYPGSLKGTSLGGLYPITFGSGTTLNYSGYGEVYYEFFKDFKLTLGGRYNVDKRQYDSQDNPDAAILSELSPLTFHGDSGRHNYYDFTPRAVLSYNSDFGNFYLSWNRGFKSGGFNIPSFGIQTPVSPEKIEAVELGAKLHFLDNKIRTESAIFHYDWDNLQVAFIDSKTGGLFQENAAAAEAIGLEQSIDAAITHQFTVGASFAYLHSRFLNFRSAASYVPAAVGAITEGLDLANTPVPNAPSYSGSIYGTLHFGLPAQWAGSITLLARFQTRVYFDAGAGGPQRYDQQGAYGIMNITGNLTPPDLPLTLDWFIDNATDTEYASLRQSSTIGNYQVPGLPRTYGIRLTYDF